MKRFTEAIRKSLETNNWYSALCLALTLPDICGKLDMPHEKFSGARYAAWFDKWMTPHYTSSSGQDRHIFMSGTDCYALRCAYLHEGDEDITNQSAQKKRDILNKFVFLSTTKNAPFHCNSINKVLMLRVDIFAGQIADEADRWFESQNQKVAETISTSKLLLIRDADAGFSLPGSFFS